MTIHIQTVLVVILCIVIWLKIYLITLLMRFGSELTEKSEAIALIVSAIPVVVGVLSWYEIIKFTW